MLIDSKTLSSGAALSEAEKMQRERLRVGDLKGIISYSWSADSKSVLVPLDGALYLAGLDGHVQKLSTGADPLNPALSPSGKFVSFVRDRRFWVVPVAGGEAQAITRRKHRPPSIGARLSSWRRRKWRVSRGPGGRPMTAMSPSSVSTRPMSAS
jgi:hypothetical protein